MRNFLSRAEADEICDGLMERYHEEKGVSCVDIDGFVKDVLRCPVFYEAFAEKDLDKIGFCGDGISKLKVLSGRKAGFGGFPQGHHRAGTLPSPGRGAKPPPLYPGP